MIRNENFAFPAGPTTPKLYLRVLDHRTLGKDKTVGEAEIDVSFSFRYLLSYIMCVIIDQHCCGIRSGVTSNRNQMGQARALTF